MSSYTVKGAPRVIIPYEIYEWFLGWMKAIDDEVSWRGLADWDANEIRITEAFLPKQIADEAEVVVQTAKDGGDFGQWQTNCVRNGTFVNKDGICRYKLHMHKHTGLEWSDLFESTIDEDNTKKYGVKNIDWMIHGRGVESGKLRICLEIFKPIKMSVDFLPVYVEYEGNLILVSNPEELPSVEKEITINLDLKKTGLDLPKIKERKKYFAGLEITKEEVKKWRTCYVGQKKHSQVSYFTEKDLVDVASVVSISEKEQKSGFQCVIEKHDRIIFASPQIKVGPWNLLIEGVPVNIRMPELAAIRKTAEKQVKEKVKKIVRLPEKRTSKRYRAISKMTSVTGGDEEWPYLDQGFRT